MENATANGSMLGTPAFMPRELVVHPTSGKVYVSNTDARNEERFEGPGDTSKNGQKLHAAMLGTSEIAVYDTGELEDDTFEPDEGSQIQLRVFRERPPRPAAARRPPPGAPAGDPGSGPSSRSGSP